MNRPFIIGILLFLLVFGGLFYFIKHRPVETEHSPVETILKPEPQEIRRVIQVKLFFGTPGSAVLVPEKREVPFHDTLHSQAREVLIALIAGPKEKLVPTIPAGTKLLDFLTSKGGTAYVDFSGEIVSNHGGGTTGEMTTIYSIVNTLTVNFPQIHDVQILVDDRAVETLKGHMDLSRPVRQDLSQARKENEPQKPEGSL